MRMRLLKVQGSLSSALQTMYLVSPGVLRTISHLRPVGKPAPPMPRSSLALRLAMRALVSPLAASLRAAP